MSIVIIVVFSLCGVYELKNERKFSAAFCFILAILAFVAIIFSFIYIPPPYYDLSDVNAFETRDDTIDQLNTINDDFTGTIYVRVYDYKYNGLEGISVTIEGPNNAIGAGTTDSEGWAEITLDSAPTLASNTDFGSLLITATYQGQTVSTQIIVMNSSS